MPFRTNLNDSPLEGQLHAKCFEEDLNDSYFGCRLAQTRYYEIYMHFDTFDSLNLIPERVNLFKSC